MHEVCMCNCRKVPLHINCRQVEGCGHTVRVMDVCVVCRFAGLPSTSSHYNIGFEHVCVHVCVCVCVYVCVCVCVCVCMCVCMCVYLYARGMRCVVCANVSCLCVHMHKCVHMVYAYMYIYL